MLGKMKQGLESNGFSFPLKVIQPKEKLPRIRYGQKPWTRHRRGTGQTTQVINQDRIRGSAYGTAGLSEAGCQQCQRGAAFPDDCFWKEEKSRELEAETHSWSLGPSSPSCPHLPHCCHIREERGVRGWKTLSLHTRPKKSAGGSAPPAKRASRFPAYRQPSVVSCLTDNGPG